MAPTRRLALDDFREIYREHFDFVWRTLVRFGVREQDAQDIAQQVFIVVYRKLDEFEQRSALRTWIFQICVRAASDYRRRAAIRLEVATEPAEMDFLSVWPSQQRDDVDGHQRVDLAHAILNKMPEERRCAF